MAVNLKNPIGGRMKANAEIVPRTIPEPSFPRPLGYLIVSFVGIACFWNALHCDLVHDDVFAIKDNADLKPDAPLTRIFSNDFWGRAMSSNKSHKSYRPLCTLTFRLNYAVHGLEPFGYHLVNVLLHILVSVIFVFMCETVILNSFPASLVAGLLFVAHPVHTEAVTGVVGRADVLACLLFQLSFLTFTRCTTCTSHVKSAVYLISCAVLGSAAMLVKEHGITVFGVCVAYDIFIVSRATLSRLWDERDIQAAVKEAKHTITRILLLHALVFCLLVFRVWMLAGSLPQFGVQDNPASFADSLCTRVMTYSYLAAFNCWLLLSPNVLSYDWQIGSIPLVESIGDVRNLATLSLYLILLLLVWRGFMSQARTSRQCFMGVALLVLPFLPASNVFLRVGFVVAERILYIPSMGFCILVIVGFNNLQARLSTRSAPHSWGRIVPVLMKGALVLLIVLFCWKTIDRNQVWKDRENLFRSGVETLPHNAKVHYNYANFLKDVGRDSEAIQHYKTALTLTPEHVSAHNNLGTLLTDDKEAMEHFNLAIKYDPDHANSYFNLGSRFGIQKKFEEAEKFLREALRINPQYVDAILNLAAVLNEKQNAKEAEKLYAKALTLQPSHVDALNNYGVFLAKMERNEEALARYQAALEIAGNNSVVLVNMARLLRTMQRTQEAERLYKRALAVKEEANTWHLLGGLYFNTERLADAARAWQEALKLEPQRDETRSNYAILLSRTGHQDEAVKILRSLVESNPQNVEYRKSLSNVYAQSGKITEAILVIEKALDIRKEADLYFHRGNLQKDLNMMTEAGKSFEKAVQLNPAHASAHLNLGVIFHLQKNYALARKHYERALALDPDNAILRQNLQKLSRIEQPG